MGLRSPDPPAPARTPIARATRIIAGIAIAAAAGCSIVSAHGGDPAGPTIGGTDRPGTGAPRVAQTCRVYVSNETGVSLDVTYIVQSTDGATRHGNLGRIERGDSRNTTVRCGETVTAFGWGGGRTVQGSVVARQMDDNWIHLTEGGSPAAKNRILRTTGPVGAAPDGRRAPRMMGIAEPAGATPDRRPRAPGFHAATSRFARLARHHRVRGHVVPAGACNPCARVSVQGLPDRRLSTILLVEPS